MVIIRMIMLRAASRGAAKDEERFPLIALCGFACTERGDSIA
jgi:hypothetical protein